MAELLLELLSEEIPARMQAQGANALSAALSMALLPLKPTIEVFFGPRRIATRVDLSAEAPAYESVERGPRRSAPESALQGFLRKHGASAEQVIGEGDYWILRLVRPARPASDLIAAAIPTLLRRFPWPKSMRWGDGSALTWVRPLRRILCILDGAVVPFDLKEGEDDGHGLASSNLTEGHSSLAHAPFAVSSADEWREGLLTRRVVVKHHDRNLRIRHGLAALAKAQNLTVVQDEALLQEVTGLVEWPVPLLGRISPEFMDLPPEVLQVSMRVHQRYFALRSTDGAAAPWFAFVANIEAPDSGAAIIVGNERVLRARFADAAHFWKNDRATRLEARIDALKAITFHARLGSQSARVARIGELASKLAAPVGASREMAVQAARLSKADLTTGMVGEFPELQGIMGGYYAKHDGLPAEVARAIREHYLPKAASDPLPSDPVGVAVSLADRLDTIAGFFSIGETPTGSGDPYALRRAALGVIRLVREKNLTLPLRHWIEQAGESHDTPVDVDAVLDFFLERLRVQLRADGARYDVVNAVLNLPESDDILQLLNRAHTLETFLATDAGGDLLTLYRRVANILRIEQRKDGVPQGPPDPALLEHEAERALQHAIYEALSGNPLIVADYQRALSALAQLRGPLDRFFEEVLVNDPQQNLRINRLKLLGLLRDEMNQVADFSKIEG
jgi:glycyl-tRNA synthetase beta chain